MQLREVAALTIPDGRLTDATMQKAKNKQQRFFASFPNSCQEEN
jgi:hypothetical protein